MKAFLCTLLLGFSLAQLASAQGKIEGAFGKKLGDTFDPGGTPNEWTRNEAAGNYPGYQRYRFTPTAPFKGLTDYFVDVTPTTHRIFAITAMGGMADETEARRFVALLDIILAEKYAADPPPPQPADRKRIRVLNGRNDFANSRPIEQSESSRMVKASASNQPGIPRPVAGQVTPPAPPSFSVSVVYTDRKVSDLAAQETEVIKKAQEDVRNAEEDAKQKKLAAEEAKKRAAAEEARLKDLVILKKEAAKLDSSGL